MTTSNVPILDPNSFVPRKGILTRYGKKLLEDGRKYYGTITISAAGIVDTNSEGVARPIPTWPSVPFTQTPVVLDDNGPPFKGILKALVEKVNWTKEGF